MMTKEIDLTTRTGEPPQIGLVPPQLQFSDFGSEKVRMQLKEWAFTAFPNVSEHDTLMSVPSSRAMWFAESVPAAHSDAFMPGQNSREFCHLHEDGILHAVVSNEAERNSSSSQLLDVLNVLT